MMNDIACSAAETQEAVAARKLLNERGVRYMMLDSGPAIGVWGDTHGPDVQAALRTVQADGLPLMYLDGCGIPMRYKLRRVPGQPVPLSVLREMERATHEPWAVRDRMLRDSEWHPEGIPFDEWHASAVKSLFREFRSKRKRRTKRATADRNLEQRPAPTLFS